MKRIFPLTVLTLFLFANVFATDRFVNPNLSQGNGTTLFTTITDAVAAAENGDRIIVTSSTYNEAELTIDKSLQIIPQTAGATINFNANIIVSGFVGMNLEIVGFDLGSYYFHGKNINNGSYTNRSSIKIIDCIALRIVFNEDFYDCIFLNNEVEQFIAFRHGNVIKNTTNHIVLLDELQNNNPDTNIKNKIIQNNVTFLMGIYNNDYPFLIANNSFRDLSVRKWCVSENALNEIINNDIKSDATFQFASINVPEYNLRISNNLFEDTFYHNYDTCSTIEGHFYGLSTNQNQTYENIALMNFGQIGGYTPAYALWFGSSGSWTWGGDTMYNPIRPNVNNCIISWVEAGTSDFPNLSAPGFFEWSYNGIDFNCNVPDSSSPLTLNKIVGQTNPIDGGNPNNKYYDIDLTINDRGINGGPYSQLNYNASNPNNSRAFIFDLEMPSDIFPNENIEIKAKAYHKN